MKHSLIRNLLLSFVILALLFLLISFIPGRNMTKKETYRIYAASMKRELAVLNDLSHGVLARETTSENQFMQFLETVSANTGSDIRVIDTAGNILISTVPSEAETVPLAISGFDFASYSRTGDFYGLYDEPYLTVIVPSESGLEKHGFLAASRSLKSLEPGRRRLMSMIRVILLLACMTALLFFIAYSWFFYHPLDLILNGMRRFADGRDDYHVQVNARNEISELASDMMYLADRIRQQEEYERQFIVNVSHDIRSPLTSIKGFTDAMLDGTIPPEDYEKYLTIISEETDRLTALAQSVLNLNALESGKEALSYRVFDINELVRRGAFIYKGQCRDKDLSIRLILSEGPLMVRADEEKIKLVLSNLLDNALKFSPAGSEITIETTAGRTYCYVFVRDEGPGIAREDLPRIWDRFYKKDSSRGVNKNGTGLGLAIVREIIQKHGQTITVVSTEGGGTEFRFSLEAAH